MKKKTSCQLTLQLDEWVTCQKQAKKAMALIALDQHREIVDFT